MRGGTYLNVKPAMGFTLPSAGVTPAPSTNREMARTPFRSQVLGGLRANGGDGPNLVSP